MGQPAGPWTIGTLLDTAAGYLREKGSPSARLDAELLLAETLTLERIELYTQHERPLTAQEVASYRALIARRAKHEPVAYIRGRAYFRHLSLEVRPGVLIPRPETEELVDVALGLLRRRPLWEDLPADTLPIASPLNAAPAAGAPFTVGPLTAVPSAATLAPSPCVAGRAARALPAIADVGTGSGAIALSLAEEAGVRVLALDDSPQALAVAGANARALGLSEQVVIRHGDLLAGVAADTLALVVSNPPYVRSGDILSLAPDIRLFEPLTALDGGPDGLDVYRRLMPQAARALRPGGTMLLEVGEGQAPVVCDLARAAGFVLLSVHKDLSRKDRMVEAVLPGAPAVTIDDLGRAEVRALRLALDAGAIMGVPTDTVYGLAARWDLAAGVRRLFAAKQRPPDQPVAVIFPSLDSLRAALPDLHPAAARVLAALLPGPYTFVVATSVARPEHVGTPGSLGVRMPDHPPLLRLLAALDLPLAATSANLSGLPDAVTAEQVDPLVLAHCTLAVVPASGSAPARDGGDVPGVASTVVDLRPLAAGSAPLVLREGAVSGEEALGRIRACV